MCARRTHAKAVPLKDGAFGPMHSAAIKGSEGSFHCTSGMHAASRANLASGAVN
jgi:hypothetical protein